MRIGQLRRVLRDSGVLGEVGGEPASAELADAVWLAALRRSGRLSPPIITDVTSGEDAAARNQNPSVTEKSRRTYKAQRSPVRRQALDSLPLARAMRPLRRLVPSATEHILDEEATVYLSAEQRLWLPALSPANEPAFDLALVVDNSESMALWGDTVREFRQLCESLGAFRDVRVWRLAASGNDSQARPTLRTASHSSGTRNHRELNDPSGRRLILLVTDGVHPWWRLSGSLRPIVAQWALSSPLAVVQLLPQRLWSRSLLRIVRQEFRPGWPGAGPTIHRAADRRESGSVSVPVLELAPTAMRLWAEIISGASRRTSLPAVVLPRERAAANDEPGNIPNSDSEDAGRGDPAQLVRDFRASVSPAAYRLAGYLSAAAPLTLPVMRLVQDSMMPDAGPAELAEVVLSGLLRRAVVGDRGYADNTFYVFTAGVREVLQSTLTRGEALSVLDQAGSYLAKRQRGGQALLDLLEGHLENNEIQAAAEEFPENFGRITGMLLERIGGPYAEALRLRANPDTAVREVQEGGETED